MSTFKRLAGAFLVGLLGCMVGLGLWRAYSDYNDFRAMRLWVAEMQQLQVEAQKAQQKPAQVQQAPAPEAK